MPITLPKPVDAYFAADTKDGVAIARYFSPDAVVIDEGHSYSGRDAIARWKTEASTKYDYVSEPIAVTHEGAGIVVTSRVTGNFPGSPVDLRYGFVIANDLIGRLEIVQ